LYPKELSRSICTGQSLLSLLPPRKYTVMKIAIAGVGDVGRYLVEEFTKSQHQIVALTRSSKPFLADYGVEERISDYTVDNLVRNLQDCDAVVSSIAGTDDSYVTSHLAILSACSLTTRCKRFIPSEWSINIENFPDQPSYNQRSREIVRMALRNQKNVEWTLISSYWFMDYLLPSSQRHLKDLGLGWFTNNEQKKFEIYGDGGQLISLTSVRDAARASLKLLESPGVWREFTHITGQTLTYLELFNLLKQRDQTWTANQLSFSDAMNSIVRGKSCGYDVSLEELRIMGFTRCNSIASTALPSQRGCILSGFQARTVEQFLDEADRDLREIP
jgi:swainsonine biosynthesis oxidoreductase SwnR